METMGNTVGLGGLDFLAYFCRAILATGIAANVAFLLRKRERGRRFGAI